MADIGDCCVTDYLLTNPFGRLSYPDKLKIAQSKRVGAMPKMIITAKRGGKSNSNYHFHENLYEKYSWMCGSCKLNKMFCFPCLLFSNSDCVWTKTGYSDLGNLTNSSKKHVKTEKHIRSVLCLIEFGAKKRIEESLGNSFKAHNKKVDKNRKLMKRFIDAVIFLSRQELPFRGHNESRSSENRGNYVELLSLISNYDETLESHLENCGSSVNPAFSGLSNAIQNALIHSIASLIRHKIKDDISKSDFVSIIVDESPDISHREQMSFLFRYVCKSSVVERFVGFFDCSSSRTALLLTEKILEIVDLYDCKSKLIGQSYDNAAVMSGERGGVQKLIREKCPNVLFIPCYAHTLNLVLSRALEKIPDLKSFFGTINRIVRFFNKSSKRTNLLKKFADRRMPGVSETRWVYHSRIVNVIDNCRPDIINTLNNILDNSDDWDSDSLSLAEGFLIKLNDFFFCFILEITSLVFSKTDVLFNLLQNSRVDLNTAKNHISAFEFFLNNEFLNKFDSIFENIRVDSRFDSRLRRVDDIKSRCLKFFIQIKDRVLEEVNSRYENFLNLKFIDLVNKTKYSSFSENFPDYLLSNLICHFPNSFDFSALKNELKVLYTTPSLNEYDNPSLYFYLVEFLSETFPQCIKLIKIILTLPISVSSAERSFSALKRIHTYLRNSQSEDRLSDLALISVEKNILLKLKSESNFYDMVIDEFLKKDRRIELVYK
jgi:hypothetical protein